MFFEKNNMKKILTFLLILSLASCSYRPILDPHGKYLEVGEEQADADIDECKKEADAYFDKIKMERAGKEAVRKGVIWTVLGTALGFFIGGNTSSTLTGAAFGAGGGAAVGGLSVLGEDKVTPDQLKQNYMTRCLAEKGYVVLGWK